MWNFILAAGFIALIGAAVYEGEKHDKEESRFLYRMWSKIQSAQFLSARKSRKIQTYFNKMSQMKIESVLTMYKPPENEFQDYKVI